jgi:phytoene synthase
MLLAVMIVAARGLVAPAANVGSQAAIQALMKKHDPILLWVSRLMSQSTAEDAGALYAWCRRLDQLVDEPESSDPAVTVAALDDWTARLDSLCEGQPRDEMDAALTQTLRRHPTLNRDLFADMVQGMRADVDMQRRIADYAELETYAYQVAGTVGLMLLPLLGLESEAKAAPARGPAVALGQAVQLINILRDARPDAAMGRIYLPRDEMAALGVSEADVLAGQCTPAYRELVARTAGRAEALLQRAEGGVRALPGAGPLLAQTIIELYRDYLVELEARGHDNLSAGGERVKVSTARKLGSTLRAIARLLRPQ